MNKKYKLNKEWLDLMLENKNNTNLTFNLSDNDTRILLTYIEFLQQENARLKDNWNKLKEHLKNRYDNGTESISYRQVFMEIREAMQVLEIAQELEGSDSNE